MNLEPSAEPVECRGIGHEWCVAMDGNLFYLFGTAIGAPLSLSGRHYKPKERHLTKARSLQDPELGMNVGAQAEV